MHCRILMSDGFNTDKKTSVISTEKTYDSGGKTKLICSTQYFFFQLKITN